STVQTVRASACAVRASSPERARRGSGRRRKRIILAASSDEIRQRDEFLDGKRLGAAGGVYAGRRQQALAAQRLQALAQHLAALAEGGFRHPRELLLVGRQRVFPGQDVDDGGGDLRRRRERLRRQVEGDPRLG